ncbi:helix-turn-helix domain-containing protein [Glycomyces sp. NPDC048151]|uniref:helix-turn-helix transcriptional regulator n=1 Tax=Glycomyces sp. NPDC048151 TaxID=3364002 RepID=UPI003712C61B
MAAQYEERAAQGPLGPWSPCVWVRRVSGAGVARIVPDACTDLLWRRGALEVAGPDTAHRDVPVAPGEVIVGVRLRPGAARPLLGETPATDVADAQPDLRELWGEAALRLSDSLLGREPWQVAGTLADALGKRLGAFGPDRVAIRVADALDRPRPPAISRLAWELGYSERHLRRRVQAATGYGPKTLEQILRFRRTLEAAAPVANPPGFRPLPDWSRIAAEQGYADQAHLSRQVRRWSGRAPSTLVQAA